MEKVFYVLLFNLLFGLLTGAVAQTHTVFLADTRSYRLYTTENPCIDESRKKLTFRAEFRDPVLARNPDIVARAAVVGASVLKKWPNRYTCINTNNFLGEVTSYYNGDLMFRVKTHLTDNLRNIDTQSTERFGKLKRGTPFSLVLRAYADGAYGGDWKTEPDFAGFLSDIENAEITEAEKPDRDFVVASVLDRGNGGFPASKTAISQEAADRLASASLNGVEGATLHLLYRAGIRDVIYTIRSRAQKGKTELTGDEKAAFATHKALIDRALQQRVGLMLMLKSEMDRLGISIDPSVASTYVATLPNAEDQVVPYIKAELLNGKFCKAIQRDVASVFRGSEVMDYFKTGNGCGMKAFTGANVEYTFMNLKNEGCSSDKSCRFSTQIRCVWQGLVMAQNCEGFEGAGLKVAGTVFFKNGKADRYEID